MSFLTLLSIFATAGAVLFAVCAWTDALCDKLEGYRREASCPVSRRPRAGHSAGYSQHPARTVRHTAPLVCLRGEGNRVESDPSPRARSIRMHPSNGDEAA